MPKSKCSSVISLKKKLWRKSLQDTRHEHARGIFDIADAGSYRLGKSFYRSLQRVTLSRGRTI